MVLIFMLCAHDVLFKARIFNNIFSREACWAAPQAVGVGPEAASGFFWFLTTQKLDLSGGLDCLRCPNLAKPTTHKLARATETLPAFSRRVPLGAGWRVPLRAVGKFGRAWISTDKYV